MGAAKVTPIVIDTNVVVSALLFGGTPGRLVALWKQGRIKPFVSPAIMAEFVRVLAYPKFDLSEKEIQYLLYNEILPFFEVTTVQSGDTIISADPSDDSFLRCATKANVEFIISGDRHLLALKSYNEIPIVTPAKFFACIQE